MISGIIERANQITGREDGWARPRGYKEKRSRKAFLADVVIKLTEEGSIKSMVASKSGNLV